MTSQLVAEFVFNKETPGAYQMKEDGDPAVPPISGSLYLKKYAVAQLNGYQGRIRVTIEAI